MGGPARAADAAAQPAAAQPAAAPQHQQPPQQHQQRTRLSGGRGLHCSPRRRRRAALRAGPRAAWSHAPPAPRALGPAPRPRPASPLFRRAPLRGTRRPKFPLAPSGSGAREPAPLPGGAQTPGAGRREGRGVDHCPPHHCKGMARGVAERVGSEVTAMGSQEAHVRQEPAIASHDPTRCKSDPWLPG